MVPTVKQLPGFAESIAEALQGNTTLFMDEMEVVFYTNHETLQKVNEDFYYSTGRDKEEGSELREINELDVKSHGIKFIYKEREEEK